MKTITYIADPNIGKKETEKKTKTDVKRYQSKKIHEKQEKYKGLSAVQKLQAEYAQDKGFRVLLPWYVKWLFILVWVFIVIVIVNIVIGLFHMETWLLWWKRYNGSKYKRVFSMTLLSEYNFFSLGYEIIKEFYSEYTHIPTKGVGEFITNIIYSYGKINDQDPVGFLLPLQLCENIAVGTLPDGDKVPDTSDIHYQYDSVTGWPIDEGTWRLRS
jgi:hypothetical protein